MRDKIGDWLAVLFVMLFVPLSTIYVACGAVSLRNEYMRSRMEELDKRHGVTMEDLRIAEQKAVIRVFAQRVAGPVTQGNR